MPPLMKNAITSEHEELLWNTKLLSTDTSIGLIQAVIFYLIKCFGLWQGKDLKLLKTDHVTFSEDEIGKFVAIDIKRALGSGKIVKRYDDEGNPRSVYKIMKTYVGYLANEGPFLVRPISSIKDYVCYSPWPVGLNILEQTVVTIMQDCGFGQGYGNVSVSLMSIDILKNFGAGSHCISTWFSRLYPKYKKMFWTDAFRECSEMNCEDYPEVCLMISHLLDPPYPTTKVLIQMKKHQQTLRHKVKAMAAKRSSVFTSWISNINSTPDNPNDAVAADTRCKLQDEKVNNKRKITVKATAANKAKSRSRNKDGNGNLRPNLYKDDAAAESSELSTVSMPTSSSSSLSSNITMKTEILTDCEYSDINQKNSEMKIMTVLSIPESAFSAQVDEGESITGGSVAEDLTFALNETSEHVGSDETSADNHSRTSMTMKRKLSYQKVYTNSAHGKGKTRVIKHEIQKSRSMKQIPSMRKDSQRERTIDVKVDNDIISLCTKVKDEIDYDCETDVNSEIDFDTETEMNAEIDYDCETEVKDEIEYDCETEVKDKINCGCETDMKDKIDYDCAGSNEMLIGNVSSVNSDYSRNNQMDNTNSDSDATEDLDVISLCAEVKNELETDYESSNEMLITGNNAKAEYNRNDQDDNTNDDSNSTEDMETEFKAQNLSKNSPRDSGMPVCLSCPEAGQSNLDKNSSHSAWLDTDVQNKHHPQLSSIITSSTSQLAAVSNLPSLSLPESSLSSSVFSSPDSFSSLPNKSKDSIRFLRKLLHEEGKEETQSGNSETANKGLQSETSEKTQPSKILWETSTDKDNIHEVETNILQMQINHMSKSDRQESECTAKINVSHSDTLPNSCFVSSVDLERTLQDNEIRNLSTVKRAVHQLFNSQSGSTHQLSNSQARSTHRQSNNQAESAHQLSNSQIGSAQKLPNSQTGIDVTKFLDTADQQLQNILQVSSSNKSQDNTASQISTKLTIGCGKLVEQYTSSYQSSRLRRSNSSPNLLKLPKSNQQHGNSNSTNVRSHVSNFGHGQSSTIHSNSECSQSPTAISDSEHSQRFTVFRTSDHSKSSTAVRNSEHNRSSATVNDVEYDHSSTAADDSEYNHNFTPASANLPKTQNVDVSDNSVLVLPSSSILEEPTRSPAAEHGKRRQLTSFQDSPLKPCSVLQKKSARSMALRLAHQHTVKRFSCGCRNKPYSRPKNGLTFRKMSYHRHTRINDRPSSSHRHNTINSANSYNIPAMNHLPSISSNLVSNPSSSQLTETDSRNNSGIYHYRSDHIKKVAYQTVKVNTETKRSHTFSISDLPFGIPASRDQEGCLDKPTSEICLGDYFPQGAVLPMKDVKLLTRQGSCGLEVILKFEYSISQNDQDGDNPFNKGQMQSDRK